MRDLFGIINVTPIVIYTFIRRQHDLGGVVSTVQLYYTRIIMDLCSLAIDECSDRIHLELSHTFQLSELTLLPERLGKRLVD